MIVKRETIFDLSPFWWIDKLLIKVGTASKTLKSFSVNNLKSFIWYFKASAITLNAIPKAKSGIFFRVDANSFQSPIRVDHIPNLRSLPSTGLCRHFAAFATADQTKWDVDLCTRSVNGNRRSDRYFGLLAKHLPLVEVIKCVFQIRRILHFHRRRAFDFVETIQCARLRSLHFDKLDQVESVRLEVFVFPSLVTWTEEVCVTQAISGFFSMKMVPAFRSSGMVFSGKFTGQWNCANRPRFPVASKGWIAIRSKISWSAARRCNRDESAPSGSLDGESVRSYLLTLTFYWLSWRFSINSWKFFFLRVVWHYWLSSP